MALVAFHFYAMAIEAAARIDLGEMHAATLVATTALGAVENLQGCEYGLEIRSLCADALKRAGSPQAASAHQRAVDYARALMNSVRDARIEPLFSQAPDERRSLRDDPYPLSTVVASKKFPPAPPSAASPGSTRDRMTTTTTASGKRRVRHDSLGGGARGAYEVGVLWYVFDD